MTQKKIYPYECDHLISADTKRKHNLKRHIQLKHSRCEVTYPSGKASSTT